GYDIFLTAKNGGASIGAVNVKGDWIASSIVAGAQNAGKPKFGDGNDTLIDATKSVRIASVTIGGEVLGTPSGISNSDHFGFVSHHIGPVKIGGNNILISALDIPVGITADFDI